MVTLIAACLVLIVTAGTGVAKPRSTGLYPDLRTVVPTHLQLVNRQQRTVLRFSNGIANTGDGPWRLRPDFQPTVTNAIQEILDAQGNIVQESAASTFGFHPAHNHWHIGDIALFEIRAGRPTGPIVAGNSVKVTFCLIDWYTLEGNSATKDRGYWDCANSYQGISVGWVDQYHHSLEGQQLDLTGVQPGRYYLVSTANYAQKFLEKNVTNNSAWIGFEFTYDATGNAKLTIVDHSPCETPGLCGEGAPNR
jgi:hypothetical protein